MKKLFLTIMPLFLLPLALMAQIRVEGTVVDSHDYPIPGVNVYIKNTTTGTITDINGVYTLTGVAPDAVLVFSSVGMKTQEITVNSRSQLNLIMEDEMVVAAAEVDIDFILDERARELVGEQWRWYDLKRTGKLNSAYLSATNPAITSFNSELHLKRPIPINFLNAISNANEFGTNGY